MNKHLLCLYYLARHKWFVFLAACRLGIPWTGVIHDWSKLRPSEWMPYARFFASQQASKCSAYKPVDTGDKDFDFAWVLHQKRNRHHWQFWVIPSDNGGVTVLPIPDRYRREMVADWLGAGRAMHGRREWQSWYMSNQGRIQLHPETRAWLERLGGIEPCRKYQTHSCTKPGSASLSWSVNSYVQKRNGTAPALRFNAA